MDVVPERLVEVAEFAVCRTVHRDDGGNRTVRGDQGTGQRMVVDDVEAVLTEHDLDPGGMHHRRQGLPEADVLGLRHRAEKTRCGAGPEPCPQDGHVVSAHGQRVDQG